MASEQTEHLKIILLNTGTKMRIHEIILESEEKPDLASFMKELIRAEKDAIDFLDDEDLEQKLDEDFKSKIKKAAAIGALGLAGLGAGGAADAQSIGNSPFDYQRGNTMVALSACAADMVTMSQIASKTGNQQKANYYNTMANKAKNLVSQAANGDRGQLQYANNIYNSHLSKNNKYLNMPNGWSDRLQQGINSTLQKCINLMEPQPQAQPQSQPKPQAQPQPKPSTDNKSTAADLQAKIDAMQRQITGADKK